MTIPELEEELRRRDSLIQEQAALIQEQAARIRELERQIEELKKLLVVKAESKEAKAPKPAATNFSVDAHERKQRKKKKRRRNHSGGRRPKDQKRDVAALTFELYWHHADR